MGRFRHRRQFLYQVGLCRRLTQLGAVQGLTSIQSHFDPKETTDRLVAAMGAKGMTVFSRIDHAAGAAEVGLTLRPMELIIFGNAHGATPLMQPVQTVGIDLSLKVLVLEDAGGRTGFPTTNQAGFDSDTV